MAGYTVPVWSEVDTVVKMGFRLQPRVVCTVAEAAQFCNPFQYKKHVKV